MGVAWHIFKIKELTLLCFILKNKTKESLPEIEGLGINVGLCEKSSDVVKAPLHDGQMQS